MSGVFADTFYFVALTNPRDSAHESAMTITAALQGDMVTTEWVLTEFANHMCAPHNRGTFLEILKDLRDNDQVTIVPADSDLFDDGVELFGARADKEWSLTDCISFLVMEREGITDALTGHHHFEQAGFVALLK